MADRTGQTTHEFTTNRIIQFFLGFLLLGFILGIVAVVLGVYTNVYGQLLTSLALAIVNNPLLDVALIGTVVIVAYVNHKIEGKNKKPKPVSPVPS